MADVSRVPPAQPDHLAVDLDNAPIDCAVAANNDFALDLYRQMVKEYRGENVFFSPYSMSGALAMTQEGARGETAAQMGKVLCFPQSARRVGDDANSVPWNTVFIHSGLAALNERFDRKPVSQQVRDRIVALRKVVDETNREAKELAGKGKWEQYDIQVNKGKEATAELNALLAQVDLYELRVANALWGDKSYPFRQSYLDTVHKFYCTSGVFPVDFRNQSEPARRQINSWVEDQTNKRIQELLPQGTVNANTCLVLTNAIYFKGEWKEPFGDEATREDDFTMAGGAKIRVRMMCKRELAVARYAAFNADGTFFPTPAMVTAEQPNIEQIRGALEHRHLGPQSLLGGLRTLEELLGMRPAAEARGAGEERGSVARQPDPKPLYPGKGGFVMAELPYKGDELSMVVLLPQNIDGLAELERKLSGDNLRAWTSKLEVRPVHVFLPKFKLETSYEMNRSLSALGMPRAFVDPRVPNGAEFDGMCASQAPEQRFYIGLVLHKAFVEVNEKGTEAAAATAVAMRVGSSGRRPTMVPFTPTFRADRPFLFVIRDMKTGTILFLGRMAHPKG